MQLYFAGGRLKPVTGIHWENSPTIKIVAYIRLPNITFPNYMPFDACEFTMTIHANFVNTVSLDYVFL